MALRRRRVAAARQTTARSSSFKADPLLCDEVLFGNISRVLLLLIFLAATVRVRFGVNHSLSLLLVLVAVVKFPFPLRDTQTFLVDGERVNEKQAGSSSRILVLSD